MTIDENNGEGIKMNNHKIEGTGELNVDRITKNENIEITVDSDITLGTNDIKSVNNITSNTINSTNIINSGDISTNTLSATSLNNDLDAAQNEITNISKLKGNNTDDFEIRNLSLIDGKSQTNPNGRKINITGGTAMEFGSSLCIHLVLYKESGC